jgi:8-oxo-dGTP pyrophosphatase MutT (NUDIX family)
MVKTPQQIFEKLTKGLPLFDDGRVNFKGVQKAPVLNAVVYYHGKVLLTKRSQRVGAYQGLWNGISGYIDRSEPIEKLVKQELSEELALISEIIKRIAVCTPYEVDDNSIDRTWFVYPVLVELNKEPNIKLDWEHTEFVWVKPNELQKYNCVKDLDISINRALNLL